MIKPYNCFRTFKSVVTLLLFLEFILRERFDLSIGLVSYFVVTMRLMF